MAELIRKIDTKALEERATYLRLGMPCSIPPLRYHKSMLSSVMGGMNYHIVVRFEDGVVWLARIRRLNATTPPPAVRDRSIESEVATLLFLERTKIPAPKVHDYALEESDNAVGVGYILMDKLPGKPLRWLLAHDHQRKKVVEQLADIFLTLRRYPFNEMGSLVSPERLQPGPIVQESLTDVLLSGTETIGPFRSVADYHEASIRFIIGTIMRQEAYTKQAVDAYLIHRFLLDLVPRVAPPSENDCRFFLKHADDKGDHILVDENYNIQGIIDWEWAYTAPVSQAFNTPVALLHAKEFYDGKKHLGAQEKHMAGIFQGKGKHELAEVVRNGRVQHWFAFCCGCDLEDWTGFLGLFRGLRAAVGVDKGISWDKWKDRALDRYKDEPDLQTLLSRQS